MLHRTDILLRPWSAAMVQSTLPHVGVTRINAMQLRIDWCTFTLSLTLTLTDAGSLEAVNRLTNSIAVLTTISFGGWLAVCGKLSVGFIYTAFTFSFQLAMGFSSLVTMTGTSIPFHRGWLELPPQCGHVNKPQVQQSLGSGTLSWLAALRAICVSWLAVSVTTCLTHNLCYEGIVPPLVWESVM